MSVCVKLKYINLLLGNDDVAIDKNVIKEKKLSWFWLLSAHLDKYTFTNKHSTCCL